MKPLTELQALDKLIEINASFRKLLDSRVMSAQAKIENICMKDLVRMYEDLPSDKRTIFLPGEAHTETLQVQWKVADGFYIIMESEPCVKLKPNLNIIEWN